MAYIAQNQKLLTEYVQKNYENRSLKRFIKNGKVDRYFLKEYLIQNTGKSKLDIGKFDGIKVVPNFSIYLAILRVWIYLKGVSLILK